MSGRVYPARYYPPAAPETVYERLVAEALAPGLRVLDVGSGNDPAVAVADRPVGMAYAGLDISRTELERAPTGSYDEIWVTDLARREPALDARFDLILSWQVLEHVKPLDVALENIRSYLRPGGQFLALMSGGLVYFALLNRLLPHRVTVALLRRANPGVDVQEIFPAPYHHCYHGALTRDLRAWSEVEIIPFHASAKYLERVAPPLCSLYLRLEGWLERGDHHNLASNYIIRATR